MGFITFFLLKKLLNKGNAFIWNSKEKNIKAIKKINTIDLKLIVGVEKQKKYYLKILKTLLLVILPITHYYGVLGVMEKVH